MVISRYWLARFLDLAQYLDAEIARIFSGLGFETEIITPPKLSNLDYGIILSAPSKLTSDVYQVVIGQQQKKKNIIINTPKLAVGSMVLLNTSLATPTCYTYQDLGISTSADVWQLPDAQKVLLMSELQQPFSANSGWQDTLFTVDIPPYRVDCYGWLFLLQELAAFIGQKFNIFDYWAHQGLFSAKNSQDAPAIPRLDQQSSISVPSYFWLLKNRPQRFTLRDFITLQRCQVPVLPTFYSVMQWQLALATGLPLIFFNYQALLSEQLVLTDRYQYTQESKKGTTSVWALMDQNRLVYLLGEEHLTTNYQLKDQNCSWIGILCFLIPPEQMRQQKKKLNQHHWWMNRWLQPVSSFAVGILTHYVQQQWPRQQLITYQQNQYHRDTHPIKIKMNWAVITTRLGITIPWEQLQWWFKRLNFISASGRLSSLRLRPHQKSELLEICVPLYRTDVTWQEHVIQEITRWMLTSNCFTDSQLHPLRAELPLVSTDRLNATAHRLEQLLYNTGWQRVYGYYLTTLAQARRFNWEQKPLYQVQQPLQKQYAIFANSILPQLFTIAQNNLHLLNQNRFFAKATLPGSTLTASDSVYVALWQSDYYSNYQSPKIYYEQGFWNLKKIWQQVCGLVGVNPEDGNLEWKSIATEYFHDVSFSPLISFSDFALSVIVHEFHFSKDVASKIGKFGKFSFQKQNYQLDPALTYLIYYHGVLVAYIGGLKQLLHNDRVEVVCHCFLEINLSQLSKLQSKLTFHQDEMHMHNSNLITRHLNYYSCKKGDYQKVKSIIKKVSPTCKIQIQDRYLLPIRSKEVPEKYWSEKKGGTITHSRQMIRTRRWWKITLNLQFSIGNDHSQLTNADVNQMIKTIEPLIKKAMTPHDGWTVR